MARDPGADDGATVLPALLLGRYRVEGKLGEGGLGTVVRAFDTRLKRTVAIKTLKRSLAATNPESHRTLMDRFAREAEAGSRVGDHPNLVTVYDLLIDADGTEYLICQYVPGGTLADRIESGPLPLADALRLTADVARGLQAAHDAGIVHRDIKPSNIFLAADGHAQVGDFGIAQMDHLSNRTHASMSHPGTPLYMSPEQAQMTGYVRPDTDQYSLGLVLFEMLTGKAYKRLRETQAEALLAQQPAAVATLVRRMAAMRPDDRYESLDEVIAAIGGIRPEPPALVPSSLQEKPSTPTPPARPRDTPRLADVTAPNPKPQQVTPYVPETPESPRPTSPVFAPTLSERTTRHQSAQSIPITPAKPSLPVPSQPILQLRTRRTVLIGMGGLAVLAGMAGVNIVTYKGNAASNQATSTPEPTRAAVSSNSAAATPAPTRIVLLGNTATDTPKPALWRDPKGRLNLTLPPGWRVVSTGTKPEDVATLSSPDGIFMLIRTYNPTRTIDGDFASVRTNQSLATNHTYTQGPVTAVTIGGEAGEYQEFHAVSTTPSPGSTAYSGVEWLVDHAGTRYDFIVADTKTRRAECDTIIASVVFPT